MADSIPSLRRKLAEAHAEIERLKGAPARVVDRVVHVKGPTVYVETPGPTRFVDRNVEGPERVVEVVREVETLVPVPMYPESVRCIDVERVVYADNPEHIATISKLQDQVWQLTSALDSLQNQDLPDQSQQSAPQ